MSKEIVSSPGDPGCYHAPCAKNVGAGCAAMQQYPHDYDMHCDGFVPLSADAAKLRADWQRVLNGTGSALSAAQDTVRELCDATERHLNLRKRRSP